MNERVANVGNQVKQAFAKVRDAWINLEKARRRMIITIAIGLIAVVVGLVIVLNVVSGRYVVLYEGMTQDEVIEAVAVLENAAIPARVSSDGQLEVPSKRANQAMAQLAIAEIPSTKLGYNLLAQASGLTTTETEKQAYMLAQWQERLEDIIKTMDGVQNAFVNLKLNSNSNRVWEETKENTGAVVIHMRQGYTAASIPVAGIQHLVGNSVGIDPEKVSVTDGAGNLLTYTGSSDGFDSSETQKFLQRQGFEQDIADDRVQKAANILSLRYTADQYRITATAQLDWGKLLTESKEYIPLEDTIHGVMSREELQAIMLPEDYAEGVVGETDNTDVPVYVDLDGDGTPEWVDYARYRDYLVTYVLEQREKDGPDLVALSLSVVVNDTLTTEDRQVLRDAISKGTNIPVENITVESFLVAPITEPGPADVGDTILGIPRMFIYIAMAALVLLIIVLILIAVLRSKAKKKRLALEAAALAAEEEEAERIQREIEERKQQLKDAAMGDQSENAITNEVKEFARNNPEITANLLRSWLREGE